MGKAVIRIASVLVVMAAMAGSTLAAEQTVGIVLLHGKQSDVQSPLQQKAASDLRAAGLLVRVPELPWSRQRYFDGGVAQAMDEIGRDVAALRAAGARRVILLGHSMGAAAAISYAALRGDIDALALSAPGHVPSGYQRQGPMRDALARAKAMVAAGQGADVAVFADSNQGERLSARMKAADYVAWFDPEGDAEMTRMAPRIKAGIPVVMIVGHQDRGAATARSMIFERLPPDPRNLFVTVDSDHRGTLREGLPQFLSWIKARARDP